MKLSEQILAKAIISQSGELAWKKDYIFDVIDEIAALKYAILGGDVWALIADNGLEPPLTRINHAEIAVGIIKGKDGVDYVYNWHSDKEKNESWEDYVRRTASESKDVITKFNAEEDVHEMYNSNIYYNLTYVNSEEFNTLED